MVLPAFSHERLTDFAIESHRRAFEQALERVRASSDVSTR
jgi:hypothetical protein